MTGVEPTTRNQDTEPGGFSHPTRGEVKFRALAGLFLPVVLALFVWLSSPGYFDPLFRTAMALAGQPLGWWLLACVVLLTAAGGLVIWRTRSNIVIGVSMVVFTFPAMVLLMGSPAIVLTLQAQQRWIMYTAPDASFSVAFPGEPYEKSSVTDSPGTLPHTDHEVGWVSSDRSTGYWVNYFDYPARSMTGANAKAEYDSAQAGAIAAAGATLVAAKDIVLGGHLGREYTAIVQGVTVTVRMYLVGDRLYKQDTNSTQPDAADIAAFFNSFQFTGH